MTAQRTFQDPSESKWHMALLDRMLSCTGRMREYSEKLKQEFAMGGNGESTIAVLRANDLRFATFSEDLAREINDIKIALKRRYLGRALDSTGVVLLPEYVSDVQFEELFAKLKILIGISSIVSGELMEAEHAEWSDRAMFRRSLRPEERASGSPEAQLSQSRIT